MRNLDPWFAVFLTSIIPGAGHWYIGRKKQAVFFLLGAYLLFCALAGSALFLLCCQEGISLGYALLFSLLCFFMILGLWLFLLRDIYVKARRAGGESRKSAWFYAFFSRIIPGLGQILLGRIFRGIFFILLYFLAGRIFSGLLLSIVWLMIIALGVLDAFRCGQRERPSNCGMTLKLFLFIIGGIAWTNLAFPLLIFKFVKLIGVGV